MGGHEGRKKNTTHGQQSIRQPTTDQGVMCTNLSSGFGDLLVSRALFAGLLVGARLVSATDGSVLR